MQQHQPKGQIIPTPAEIEAQRKADEETIVVLAATQINLWTLMNIKGDKNAMGEMMLATGQLLSGNPGFIPRFRALQAQMLKDAGYDMPEAKPEGKIIKP